MDPFDMIVTPLYLGGAGTGIAFLVAVRLLDSRAQKRPATGRPRLLVRGTPLLDYGSPYTARLFNPIFYCYTVLPLEPLGVFPMAVAWLAALNESWAVAAWTAAGTVAWRLFYDWYRFDYLPHSMRPAALRLKLLHLLGGGLWLASLAYLAWAALCIAVFVIGLAAASRRRRRW